MLDYLSEATLYLDTAVYADGDLLADVVEVERCIQVNGAGYIMSVVLLDYSSQAGALDLVFFRSHPGSLGTVNLPMTMTVAAAAEVVGWVSIVSTDYAAFGTMRIAQPEFYPVKTRAAAGGSSLWMAAVSRDTKTYATPQLLCKVGFEPS